MTPTEKYWKGRCEAAEKYISSNKTTDYKNWTTIRHTLKPSPESVGGLAHIEDNDETKASTLYADEKYPDAENESEWFAGKHGFIAGARWRGEQTGNVQCQYCGEMYHGEEPKGCCNGRDCGCFGLPVNGPFVCSKGCYDMLIQKEKHTCCARWVKASEILPEIGSYVEAWSDPKMDFSSTNIAITRFTRYGFEGAANVTHWRNIIGPDESPCTCQQELEELRAWKKQATEVMPDFQAIGKELGIPLGQTVHDKILTGIKKLKEKATVSSIGARWVKGEDLPDKDGTYICEKKPVSNNNTYFERVFFNNGKFQTAHKVVKWLDESTCSFPTREQAIEKVSWLDKEDPQRVAAITMYDWIIEQINKNQQ